MITVLLKTTLAGPGGVYLPGSRYTCPDSEGAALVAGSYAEYLKPETAVVPVPETAEIAPVEIATIQTPEKRGRKK